MIWFKLSGILYKWNLLESASKLPTLSNFENFAAVFTIRNENIHSFSSKAINRIKLLVLQEILWH